MTVDEPIALEARPRRRLAAVAFADVVGYSILMAQDGTQTLARWMAILNNVIRPLVVEHHGNLIKSIGDGVLVEFASAVDAVEWAQSVQRAIGSDDPGNGGTAIALRIAVHLGDVVSEDGDIYGDGVNVAARLQEFADPGEVVLSEAVHDLVRGHLIAEARDLGLLQLKNFERPVRAYALGPEDRASVLLARSHQGPIPSIAVLPLQNLGGDPTDVYFSEGVVEDIVVSLAGLRELLVISRNSTLVFGREKADVRDVGRALGVRYVLTGSVRRSSTRIRISVQLCDTTTGASIWADTTDELLADLFEQQDRIVRRIVAGIAPHIRLAELRRAIRKRPENFTAYDYTLRAIDIIARLDSAAFHTARDLLDRAIAEDPSFAMPHAWAAHWCGLNIGQGWSADPKQDSADAARFAIRAINLDGHNALALAVHGHLRSYLEHDYDTALTYFDRALAASPNCVTAWCLSAATLSYVGRGQQALRHLEHGLRLSPFDPEIYYWYNLRAWANYSLGAYKEALSWARMSAAENPRFTANFRVMAATLVALNRLDEAREAANRMLALEPDFEFDRYLTTRQPFRDADIKARFVGHLRMIGW
jgi:adenylate cyclase